MHGVTAVLRLLPMSAVRTAGTWLGRLAHALDARHRGVALTNLAHAFPSRSPEERQALARQVFEHFGSLLFELLKFGTLSPDAMLALCDHEGEDRVRQAYREGRGVIFCTGHFGYWEMQGIMQPLRLKPIAVMARPLDNPVLHDDLERMRTCTGNTVIYRQGALRKVLRELTQGRGVAILIDQHLQTDVVQVDFFGRPVATTAALAALALRTGAAVVPVVTLPQPGGRYRLVYERPVEPPSADSPDAIREFTQRCTDVLEMYVRRYPELWLWMHRRWREPAAPPQETSADA